MFTSLTITKYRRRFIPFALFAMAVHRLPMAFNKKISFYKLLGTGKNGTFDKHPDWRQWGILAVHQDDLPAEDELLKKLYGKLISGWFRLFRCETVTYLLEPLQGHGSWDGKQPFGDLKIPVKHEGKIATLTRATIRLNKLKYFWANVAPVANSMTTAKGFIRSYGIGEMPWVKQATFSIWESKEDMQAFAYSMKEHAEVIKRTREQQWYSEELFVRFKILHIV